MATKNTKRPSVKKPIALALQGGGMHGAFAWGVLRHHHRWHFINKRDSGDFFDNQPSLCCQLGQ